MIYIIFVKRRQLTKRGHFLDPPDFNKTTPVPQRDLSPLSNCIMRMLLHAICVWVASSNDKVKLLTITIYYFAYILQAACEELSKAVVQTEPVPPEQILNFFWRHLERDFQTMTRATQQSFDDCILFIHTLIHNMLSVAQRNIGK